MTDLLINIGMVGIFFVCCVAAYVFMVGSSSSFDRLNKKNKKNNKRY